MPEPWLDTSQAGGQSAGSLAQPAAGSGFAAAVDTRLPFNRKERYFTGTVLPGLLASDGLVHLPRFLQLCGLAGDEPGGVGHGVLDGLHPVQIFTEYSFAESLLPGDTARFPDAPLVRDTPDLVVSGPDYLLVVEAKMFHRPSSAVLDEQMRRQSVLVDYWASTLSLERSKVRHVLLLPGGLAEDRPGLDWPVVTWEQVRDAYDARGDAYWLGVLRTALDRYEQLAASDLAFGVNAEAKLTGEQIWRAAELGDLPPHWVGRAGGLHGAAFPTDKLGGTWRTRTYELRSTPPPPGNRNWFPATAFLAAVTASPSAR